MRTFEDLLKRILAGPMLFASPAVGGGAGAGDGGAGGGVDGGGGSGGGSGERSQPIATWGPPKEGGNRGQRAVGDEDSGAGAGDGAEGDFEDAEFSDADLDADLSSETDGDVSEGKGKEQTFKQFVETIKADISSQDPAVVKKAEKQLKKMYGENREFREAFETPQAARELTDRLDSLGGIEGIEAETEEAASLWSQLSTGDPQIIDTLAKDHGTGLVKLFSPLVDKMQELNGPVYAHKMAKIFMATMNSAPAGKLSGLAAINQLMKIDGVRESPEFQRLAEVINTIFDIAGTPPKEATGDPALSKKEQELQARENRLKNEQLGSKAAPVLTKSANSAIEAVLRGLGVTKLGKQATEQIAKWTHDEFQRLQKKDIAGAKNRKALLASGDHEKWLKMVKSAAARYMPLAARAAVRKYRGISGLSTKEMNARREEGNSRRESGGGGTSGGTVKVNKAPDPKIVDWERMKVEAKKHGKDVEDMFTFDRAYFKKGDPRTLYKY